MSAPAQSPTRAGKVLGWLGWAGADAVGRILLLTGSTAILSRLLSPYEFGVSALVLTVVTTMAVFVGAPFEEALAQRRGLRRGHVQAALAASWAAGLALLALSVPLGFAMAAAYSEPLMAALVPVAALSIFFSGYGDILTALARRRRRFNDVAFANLMSHVVGLTLAVLLGLAGGGVWALIGVRLFVTIARAVLLQVKFGPVIPPRWSGARARELGRFAGLTLAERLTENLTYLVFNNVVGAAYGVATLGYVNMAMRIVEPVRGAVIAIAHNLTFSFFSSLRDGADRGRSAAEISARTTYVIAPMFFGLAAVAPALIPLVAGPGWDEAVHIASLLALAAAASLPARLIFTSLSARARPEFGLATNIFGFAVTLVALLAAIPLGPIAVGLSRLLGDAAQALVAIALPASLVGWSPLARLRAFLGPWTLAGAMAVAVTALIWRLDGLGLLLQLVAGTACGALVYLALLRCFAKENFNVLLSALRPNRSRTGGRA